MACWVLKAYSAFLGIGIREAHVALHFLTDDHILGCQQGIKQVLPLPY